MLLVDVEFIILQEPSGNLLKFLVVSQEGAKRVYATIKGILDEFLEFVYYVLCKFLSTRVELDDCCLLLLINSNKSQVFAMS